MSTHSDRSIDGASAAHLQPRCIHAPGAEGRHLKAREIVTAHAMVRWLERAEGRDLRAMRQAFERHRGHAPDDGELLQFLSLYTGERLGELRARIMTPALRTAIALGASKVRRGRVWLVIAGGCVVTVLYRRRSILFRDHTQPGRHRTSKGRQNWTYHSSGADLCSA